MLPRQMVEKQIREAELAQEEAAVSAARVARQIGNRQQPVTNADIDWTTTLTAWDEPVLKMLEQEHRRRQRINCAWLATLRLRIRRD